MAGDSTGILFRVTNWGESHGPAIGVVVEGCPPGISISQELIQKDLDMRRPGQSLLTTPRKESDRVEILSGISNGKTTGTPIAMMIKNKDQRSGDYKKMGQAFRPSHADYSYLAKYGIREISGGGRSSARVTAGTVAAGAIAKKVLSDFFKSKFFAFVYSVSDIRATVSDNQFSIKQREKTLVRCPDLVAANKMEKLIEQASKDGDSLGGIIECRIANVPPGLGEPVYDKLDADLAKAILGINACKGFEIGSGFQGTILKGSSHNDAFVLRGKKVQTKTNRSGGVQGGISNGMPIVFRAAFKPTSTIKKRQDTLTTKLKKHVLTGVGRHDPCVLPRAVPIVEAAAALVLVDHALRHRGQVG